MESLNQNFLDDIRMLLQDIMTEEAPVYDDNEDGEDDDEDGDDNEDGDDRDDDDYKNEDCNDDEDDDGDDGNDVLINILILQGYICAKLALPPLSRWSRNV